MTLLAVAVAGRGIVDPATPVFFADDEALLRGAAAFETVRIRRHRPVFLRAHAARLASSARSLRLPAPEGIERLVELAVAEAGCEAGVVRLFRTERTLLATVGALPSELESMRARGIAIVTVRSNHSALLTGVKATSYATALASVAEAQRRGADDALYLGEGEIVLEATMANIWWRDEDVLSTPALATGVLPGVTRAALARLAQEAGYRVREGAFTLSALLRAEEAFTSSAVREVMPVIAIDGHEIPRGEAAERLQALLATSTDE
jgi:4-amino-4-deoxychorismate lyase